MQSTSQFSLVQSGYPFSVQNSIAIASGGNLSVTYTISGSPSNLTITIEGVKNSGTRVVLDSYSGVGNTSRSVSLSDSYDFFNFVPTWSGGTNVSIAVSVSMTGPGQSLSTVTAATPLLGSGSPAGVVAASPGTIYTNLSGGVGALWVKETGAGISGWVQSTF